LDNSKKKCLVESIVESKDNSNLATENIFKKCDVASPYESLPLKHNCIKTMNDQCHKTGFDELVKSTTSFISSSDEENKEKKCEAPSECLDLPGDKEITDEQKKKCGGKLLNLFSQNLMKPNFGSFVTPCNHVETSSNTKISFVEINKKSKTTSSDAKASVYVDMNDPKVKENVGKLISIADGAAKSNRVKIDGNTALETNAVSESDMDLINKDTDSLIQEAIVQEITPSANSNYSGEINYPGRSNGSSEYKGMKMTVFYPMLVLLITILL
jgi:hypothetical protein